MQPLLVFFSFLLFSISAFSQKYKPFDTGSRVHFTIKNFGISTGGDLSGLTGDINFVPSNLSASIFNVSVAVKTIDTDNDTRDEHLRSKDYFDAEKYPTINLASTKINKATTPGSYLFTGNLTIHGVTKNISFLFSATLKGNDYLFVGEFTINRLDYSVGSSSAVLSNPVKISLSVLAKKS